MTRALTAVLLLACVLAAPGAAGAAEGARYAVIVQGASGEPDYATVHRLWVDTLAAVLRERFGIDASHLIILAEQPKAGELRSTAEDVRATLGRLAKETTGADLVFIMLIGHGSGDGATAKFNLVGPDLAVEDWNALLRPIAARLALSTHGSTRYKGFRPGPCRDDRRNS
jgi:hypothetical protein